MQICLPFQQGAALICGYCRESGVWLTRSGGNGQREVWCLNCNSDCPPGYGFRNLLALYRADLLVQPYIRHRIDWVARHVFCLKCHQEDQTLAFVVWRDQGVGKDDWRRVIFHGLHKGQQIIMPFALILCSECAADAGLADWLQERYQLETFAWGYSSDKHDQQKCGCDRLPTWPIRDPH